MRSLFVFGLLLWAFMGMAQPTQVVRGTVSDKATRQPLIGATVMLADSALGLGGLVEEDGTFRIEGVPVGRHLVRCTYIGYAPFESDELIVSGAKETVLDIAMTEVAMQATDETVTITAKGVRHGALNEASLLSTRSFSVEETDRYAGTVNDPSRMVMGFSGVQASRENNNDIIVRGNSAMGLLWRLEGIDIPNPNHFARKGSSGGGISIFSAQLLANSDFSSGAFAAEYGNALSGVFDMKFRKGNAEKREYTFRFGLLGIDVATEGPIAKGRSSYLVNYRYSTLGLLNTMGFRLVGPRVANTFQDLSFNLSFNGRNGKSFVTVFGMGGLSSELTEAEKDTADWKIKDDYSTNDFITNMGAIGITYTHLLSEKTYIKSTLAGMASEIKWKDDTLTRNLLPTTTNSELYKEGRISNHTFLSTKLNSHLTLKTGIIASSILYNLNRTKLNPRSQQYETLIGGQGNTWLMQGYAQTYYTPTPKLTLTGGLHALWFALNHTYALEPRLGVKYQYAANQSLSLGYGLHSRVLPIGNYFTEVQLTNGDIYYPNKQLDLLRAHHIVLAHDLTLPHNLHLRTELYYQQLWGVPVAPDSTNYWLLNERDGFATTALVSTGKGQNYGIDITIEKFFSRGLFFLLSGSLYQSTYTTYTQQQFDTRLNSRYSTSLMGGKEWAIKRKNALQLGARIVYTGGYRYTPANRAASILAQELVTIPSLSYSLKVPDYLRPDLRIAYRNNGSHLNWTLSLDVQNAINRQNVLDERYDPLANDLIFRYQGTLVPVLSFRLDW